MRARSCLPVTILRKRSSERTSRRSDQAWQRINAVTSDLQDVVMRTRLQPASVLFERFPRLVRDLSRSLGKPIRLELEGREVEIDKTIVEGLIDPLTHLIRNACDHGIELPDGRAAKGKGS